MLQLMLTRPVASSPPQQFTIDRSETQRYTFSLAGERCQQRGRVSGRAAVPSLCEPHEVGPQARHVAPR